MGSQRVGHDWVTEVNWIYNKQGKVYEPHYVQCTLIHSKQLKLTNLPLLSNFSKLGTMLWAAGVAVTKTAFCSGETDSLEDQTNV